MGPLPTTALDGAADTHVRQAVTAPQAHGPVWTAVNDFMGKTDVARTRAAIAARCPHPRILHHPGRAITHAGISARRPAATAAAIGSRRSRNGAAATAYASRITAAAVSAAERGCLPRRCCPRGTSNVYQSDTNHANALHLQPWNILEQVPFWHPPIIPQQLHSFVPSGSHSHQPWQ